MIKWTRRSLLTQVVGKYNKSTIAVWSGDYPILGCPLGHMSPRYVTRKVHDGGLTASSRVNRVVYNEYPLRRSK